VGLDASLQKKLNVHLGGLKRSKQYRGCGTSPLSTRLFEQTLTIPPSSSSSWGGVGVEVAIWDPRVTQKLIKMRDMIDAVGRKTKSKGFVIPTSYCTAKSYTSNPGAQRNVARASLVKLQLTGKRLRQKRQDDDSDDDDDDSDEDAVVVKTPLRDDSLSIYVAVVVEEPYWFSLRLDHLLESVSGKLGAYFCLNYALVNLFTVGNKDANFWNDFQLTLLMRAASLHNKDTSSLSFNQILAASKLKEAEAFRMKTYSERMKLDILKVLFRIFERYSNLGKQITDPANYFKASLLKLNDTFVAKHRKQLPLSRIGLLLTTELSKSPEIISSDFLEPFDLPLSGLVISTNFKGPASPPAIWNLRLDFVDLRITIEPKDGTFLMKFGNFEIDFDKILKYIPVNRTLAKFSLDLSPQLKKKLNALKRVDTIAELKKVVIFPRTQITKLYVDMIPKLGIGGDLVENFVKKKVIERLLKEPGVINLEETSHNKFVVHFMFSDQLPENKDFVTRKKRLISSKESADLHEERLSLLAIALDRAFGEEGTMSKLAKETIKFGKPQFILSGGVPHTH